MMLHERADFGDLVRAAAAAVGMPPDIAEKDYYVTEALSALSRDFRHEIVFKGGTSLSKGWGLIDRFSEDIDIFVRMDPTDEASKTMFARKTRTKLRSLQDVVETVPGLQLEDSFHVPGKSRDARYRYHSVIGDEAGLAPTVRLEMGVRSSGDPSTEREIDSIIWSFARQQAGIPSVDVPDAFKLDLLSITRTFVEKLSCVHSLVRHHLDHGAPIGRNVRHYADLYALLGHAEVVRFAGTDEYVSIRDDIAENTAAWFPNAIPLEPGGTFADSPALLPSNALLGILRSAYDAEVRPLFYRGEPPTFDEIFRRLEPFIPQL